MSRKHKQPCLSYRRIRCYTKTNFVKWRCNGKPRSWYGSSPVDVNLHCRWNESFHEVSREQHSLRGIKSQLSMRWICYGRRSKFDRELYVISNTLFSQNCNKTSRSECYRCRSDKFTSNVSSIQHDVTWHLMMFTEFHRWSTLTKTLATQCTPAGQ